VVPRASSCCCLESSGGKRRHPAGLLRGKPCQSQKQTALGWWGWLPAQRTEPDSTSVTACGAWRLPCLQQRKKRKQIQKPWTLNLLVGTKCPSTFPPVKSLLQTLARSDFLTEAQSNIAAQLPAHLGQQHHPLPIRPDDVVHLGADPLPGQLRGPEAGLQEQEEEAGVTAGGRRGGRSRRGRGHSPHRSRCWSGPCCTRCSCSSSDPGALWSPRSCFLQAERAQMNPRQSKYKPSDSPSLHLSQTSSAWGNTRWTSTRMRALLAVTTEKHVGWVLIFGPTNQPGSGRPQNILGHMAVMSLLPGAEEDCGQRADGGGEEEKLLPEHSYCSCKTRSMWQRGVLHPQLPQSPRDTRLGTTAPSQPAPRLTHDLLHPYLCRWWRHPPDGLLRSASPPEIRPCWQKRGRGTTMRRGSLFPLGPKPGGICGLYCCSSSELVTQQPDYASTPPGMPDAWGRAVRRTRRQTCSLKCWRSQGMCGASPAGTLEQPSQASQGRCLLPGTPPLTQPRKLPQPFAITPSKMYILWDEPQILLALFQPPIRV